MSLPRFFSRVADAAIPVLGGIDADVLAGRLDSSVIRIGLAPSPSAGDRSAFLLATNLAARLYPVIALEAPADALEAATDLIMSINPACEIRRTQEVTADLWIGGGKEPTAQTVVVEVSGWAVALDGHMHAGRPPAPLAHLAAACVGVGEVFRRVFADELGARGRTERTPALLNLISLDARDDELPLATGLNLGRMTLIGAGAIGESVLLALQQSGTRAEITVVDHETVDLSNLQRYVLTRDGDVNDVKVLLAERLMSGSELVVHPCHDRWSAPLLHAAASQRTLVALDSAQERIAVQAALPGNLYNAWTQPHDLGFSRHEAFGDQACLACLYWPTEARPNRHELIASALGEHPLRTLAYLTIGSPAGLPLAPEAVPQLAAIPAPSDAQQWGTVSLLDDVAQRFGLDLERLDRWRHAPLDVLYREAVCGEAMLDFSLTAAPQEALVPLAHQSALAGVLLAIQALASAEPQLCAARASAIEGRLDVLAPWPQVVARPRRRTDGCFCGDEDYIDAARSTPAEAHS